MELGEKRRGTCWFQSSNGRAGQQQSSRQLAAAAALPTPRCFTVATQLLAVVFTCSRCRAPTRRPRLYKQESAAPAFFLPSGPPPHREIAGEIRASHSTINRQRLCSPSPPPSAHAEPPIASSHRLSQPRATIVFPAAGRALPPCLARGQSSRVSPVATQGMSSLRRDAMDAVSLPLPPLPRQPSRNSRSPLRNAAAKLLHRRWPPLLRPEPEVVAGVGCVRRVL